MTTGGSRINTICKRLTRILRGFYKRHRADITLNKTLDTFFKINGKEISKVDLKDSVSFRSNDIEQIGLRLLDFVEIEDNFN